MLSEATIIRLSSAGTPIRDPYTRSRKHGEIVAEKVKDTQREPYDVQSHFIRKLVEKDTAANRWGGRVLTRFPPEPNGYLHIGHAKSAYLNFAISEEFGGRCNLRFDDTNPASEEHEYVESIKADLRWLGLDWGEKTCFASDYFPRLSEYAIALIRMGKAYVCDLSPGGIFERRGTLTEPGTESPFRQRTVDENLELFHGMKEGKFEPGSRVLRAKIDMSSPVLTMRDPVLYRVISTPHHRTGTSWHIYPLYDFAHCLSDAIEGVTHSLCTLEFTDHRPLYDWILEQLNVPERPEQTEFARLNMTHTVMSKRILRGLVDDGYVSGWDDPRMPTLSGLRRRGYTADAIRNFCNGIGVAKRNNTIQFARLEYSLREDLNKKAPRAMAVIRPLRVILENYPDDKVEELDAVNNPEDLDAGTRSVPFSRVLYIEYDDFMEDPPKKFFRLAPGREIRLRYAYLITCREVVRNSEGKIITLLCTYDPATRGGNAPDGRKVRGTLHWVSAQHAVDAEVRLYDVLFNIEDTLSLPEETDINEHLNSKSVEIARGCKVEPSLAQAPIGAKFQFERLGYFCIDPDSRNDGLVFNRTVTLRDTWAKARNRKDT